MRTVSIIVFVVSLALLAGCAGTKGPGGSPAGPAAVRPDGDLRDEAIARYGYGGPKDQIFVDQPTITPAEVKRGARMTQEFSFAVLSSDRDREFRVLEVINLSGKKMSMELSRKTVKRKQAVITSSLNFVIPKDLPYGDYTLITSIEAKGTEKKTVSAGFKVVR